MSFHSSSRGFSHRHYLSGEPKRPIMSRNVAGVVPADSRPDLVCPHDDRKLKMSDPKGREGKPIRMLGPFRGVDPRN